MKALVPTCNRPELFARLVFKLEGFEVVGFVNNSTPENVEKYRLLALPSYVRMVYTDIAGEPKACHVKTFRTMLLHVAGECLIIEDDVLPCDDFLRQLTSRIYVLKSYGRQFTLSPILLPNRNSDFYTGAQSHPVKIGPYEFMDQAWVDGNFYMTDQVCMSMKAWLSETVQTYRSSSGIGRKNSFEIYRRGWKMYTAMPTLVEHLDQDSVMFGDRRKEVPLIAKFADRNT